VGSGYERRTLLSKAKIVVAAAFISMLMLVVNAGTAMAFVHNVTPVGLCAPPEIAGDNELAEENIDVKNPVQGIPVGNAAGHARTEVPCHQG
jgi:hypothetical protein